MSESQKSQPRDCTSNTIVPQQTAILMQTARSVMHLLSTKQCIAEVKCMV